jgi:hypothetical protein
MSEIGISVYGHQEAIASPRHRFHESGVLCRVSECIPQPAYRRIQTVVKINECVLRPERFLQLFTSYDLTRMLKKYREDPQRLFLKFDFRAATAQFTCSQIKLVGSEPDRTRAVIASHRAAPMI